MENAAMDRISSGIAGLDELLGGGLIRNRSYLVRGAPGQGKTTLGLHFLCTAEPAEPVLFVGFQESEEALKANAATVGLDVSGIRFLSLSPSETFFTQQESYDVFAAADVEQEPLVQSIIEAVEGTGPSRVFIDSLTQLRYLSADVFQYRKQVMSFLSYLTSRGATVMFSSEHSDTFPDDDLQFIADGVINLQPERAMKQVSVSKFRGSAFRAGAHYYRIDKRGITVFPRLEPPLGQLEAASPVQFGSGNETFDAMLGGGLEAGTVTLITGPTGVGKSTLAAGFAIEAAKRGYNTAIYLFEEELVNFLIRLRALEMDVDTPRRNGDLILEHIEPLRYLADELGTIVQERVRNEGIRLVVIDSVTGFDLAVQGDEGVRRPLHALAKLLSRLGASVILVNENRVSTSDLQISERDISYLSDNVIYLRYVQPDARVQRGIGVLKKRLSGFDNDLRQFEIGPGGVHVKPIPKAMAESVGVH